MRVHFVVPETNVVFADGFDMNMSVMLAKVQRAELPTNWGKRE